jgi:hypothetical protein
VVTGDGIGPHLAVCHIMMKLLVAQAEFGDSLVLEVRAFS